MSKTWVQDCRRVLDQIKELEKTRGKDRLDLVRTISFTLYALQRSVSGWIEWVNNPDVMSSFSRGELKEISKTISKLTQPFIEYDCEITNLAQGNKVPEETLSPTLATRSRAKEEDIFYVK